MPANATLTQQAWLSCWDVFSPLTHLSLLLNLELASSSCFQMAGKSFCICCPNAERKKSVTLMSAELVTMLAPTEMLFTSERNQPVRLRMEGSGPGSEIPITIHQLFLEAVESYGDHPALVFKKNGQTMTLTWRQYYEQCRTAAKSFLKVGAF